MRTRFARTRHLAIALLLAAAPVSAGEGVNLAWNHCLGEGTGVQNAVFACDTNVGRHTLVGSFVLGADMMNVSGTEMVVDLASAGPALPAWWQFKNSGTCRQSSMTANFTADPTNVVCADWTAGGAAGGLAAYCTVTAQCPNAPTAANTARIKLVDAVSFDNLAHLLPGVEYFSFNVLIDHAKTAGAGACGGCGTAVCIVFNSVLVGRPPGFGDRKISGGTGPGTDFATWQGGAVGGSGCPAATPTRRSAWGAVKTLYR